MTDEERRKIDTEIARMVAEISHIHALTAKALEEAAKTKTENRWSIAVVASAATLAIIAVTTLFL